VQQLSNADQKSWLAKLAAIIKNNFNLDCNEFHIPQQALGFLTITQIFLTTKLVSAQH
jgi:hypothetical protein